MNTIVMITVLMFVVIAVACPSAVWVSNVTIDGSIEYQTIEGLGGQMESHDPGYSSQFWDLLFDDVGVSAMYVVPMTVHKKWDSIEVFPVLRQAESHGVQSFHVEFLSHPVAWKDANNYLLPQYYDDWTYEVLSYIDYIETNTGVDITSISPFSEPTIGDQLLPRCRITANEYVSFLKVAGPIIRTGNSNVKVHAPSCWNVQLSISYANTILSDATARSYVDIVSSHGYGYPSKSNSQEWQTLANMAQTYGKETAHTEGWHGGSNNPGPRPGGVRTSKWIHEAFVDGHATTFMWWLMLDKGQYSNIPGFVFSKDWPPGEFASDGITKYGYAFKQFARWIRPGAIRVEATSDDSHVLVSSCKHPTQNTFTLVAINDDIQSKSVTFNINNLDIISNLDAYRTSDTENTIDLGSISVTGNSFTYALPKESTTTLTGTMIR